MLEGYGMPPPPTRAAQSLEGNAENSAVPTPITGGGRLTAGSHCLVSRPLTSLVPQAGATDPRIRAVSPWSECFERIFRNEEVTGSNPVSSTRRRSQGVGEPGPLISRARCHGVPTRARGLLQRCLRFTPRTTLT